MYQKILVPLDGSPRAEAILGHVEELAGRYQANVIFLQVIEPKVVLTTEGAFTPLTEQELDRDKKEAASYLAGIAGKFQAKKIETRTRIAYGPVADAIIKTAAEENVDLVAMSSHGRSGIARVFYGSVAAGVLQRVDRPLLLIRARETD
ncbi:MAG: universal stress protein [Desulfobacterales bacterium]|nr:MAG: universal stress protein [Desulfobacterales bacterium]